MDTGGVKTPNTHRGNRKCRDTRDRTSKIKQEMTNKE